jgi:hypothetical protein
MTMQTQDISALKGILNHLPPNIRAALEEYAIASEMPIEFVIEMARSSRYPQGVASFLDLDSTTFADCRTDSPGQLREQIEILQIQLAAAQGLS